MDKAGWRTVLAALAAGCGVDPLPTTSTDLALSCSAPMALCGGACVDTTSDGNNCGACGVTCERGTWCGMGRCDVACPAGQAACGDRCVTLESDRAHCGACGTACKDGEVCSAGRCATSCGGGLTNCAGTCRDL